MSGKPKAKTAKRTLSPRQVRDWLAKHPDFLARHPDVLELMKLPKPKREDGILSFQAYQADHLRERNAYLESLFQKARRNQGLIDHTLALATESVADRPRNLRRAIEAQEQRLRRHFPNAAWAIRMRPEIQRVSKKFVIPEHAPLTQAIMKCFRKGPQVLTDRDTVRLLWPAAKTDSETVLIAPLKQRRRYGILCRELPPGASHDGDTTLLLHVANLTTALLARFCKPS